MCVCEYVNVRTVVSKFKNIHDVTILRLYVIHVTECLYNCIIKHITSQKK